GARARNIARGSLRPALFRRVQHPPSSRAHSRWWASPSNARANLGMLASPCRSNTWIWALEAASVRDAIAGRRAQSGWQGATPPAKNTEASPAPRNWPRVGSQGDGTGEGPPVLYVTE